MLINIDNLLSRKKFKFWTEILIVLTIFLIVLTTRVYKLSETPLYPDEITWMVRGKETALAIRTSNFNYFKSAWWNIKSDTEAIAMPLAVSIGFPLIYLGRGQSVLSFNLFQDYIAGRWTVITISSLFFVVYYLFARKILSRRIALFSSLLLSIDPIFMANSKIIMNDIFLTIFMFIAIASYILIENRRFSILLASAGTALAFLTKPNGLLVLPVFFLQIFVNRKGWRNELKIFLSTLLLSFLFISIIWPSSWNNILFAIPEYLIRQENLLGGGINNFFLGKITNDPPIYYYLFQFFVRIPPYVFIGFAFYLVALLLKKVKKNLNFRFSIIALIFIVSFLILMSISPKKLGVRYILPIWPFVYLILGNSISLLFSKMKKMSFQLVFMLIIVFVAINNYVKLFPYHDFYYNSFIGGTKNARQYDLVGLCNGSKAAVDYVLMCYPEVTRIAALGCGRETIPYYYPHPFSYNWETEDVVTIEAYYLQLEKDKKLLEFYMNNQPTKTITIGGADLSYVYVKDDIKNNCH